jgi:hypothetical protein
MLARVLTPGPTPVTRRRVLLGVAGAPLALAVLTVSSCTEDPPAAPAPDPDREALESARGVENELRATILTWTAEPAEQSTALTVVDGHLSALDVALGAASAATMSGSPVPSASSADLPTSTATLVTRLDVAVDEHTMALRSASPQISPLLASIAASDAALGAAVRRSTR